MKKYIYQCEKCTIVLPSDFGECPDIKCKGKMYRYKLDEISLKAKCYNCEETFPKSEMSWGLDRWYCVDCNVFEYIEAEDDSGFVTCNGKGEII